MNKTEAMIDSSLISKILHDLTTFRRLGYEVSYTYTQILKSKMSASAVGVIAAFCSHRDGSGQHWTCYSNPGSSGWQRPESQTSWHHPCVVWRFWGKVPAYRDRYNFTGWELYFCCKSVHANGRRLCSGIGWPVCQHLRCFGRQRSHATHPGYDGSYDCRSKTSCGCSHHPNARLESDCNVMHTWVHEVNGEARYQA